MRTKEEIEKAIRHTLSSFVEGGDIDENASLLDREAGIVPVDFLYIFDELEKSLELNVHSIFESNTYQVMTVRMLTEEIHTLQGPPSGD